MPGVDASGNVDWENGGDNLGYCDAAPGSYSGPRCSEMDLMEANRYAMSWSTHPCKVAQTFDNGTHYDCTNSFTTPANNYLTDWGSREPAWFGPGGFVDSYHDFHVKV